MLFHLERLSALLPEDSMLTEQRTHAQKKLAQGDLRPENSHW
jgi:hypothetical protein